MYQYGNKKEALIKNAFDVGYNDFGQFSIQYGQQQNVLVWPTALYPYNYYLQFNCKVYIVYLYYVNI